MSCEPFLMALNKQKYAGFLTAELGWAYTVEPDAAAYRCKRAYDSLMQKINSSQSFSSVEAQV